MRSIRVDKSVYGPTRFVNKYKPVLHSLSPGCESCIRGDWLCFYLTPLCNADCFYCSNQLDGVEQDYPKTAENISLDADGYLNYLKTFNYKGISFSGGEPFLEFERLLQFIKITRQEFGNQHYIWLYTNGTLVTEDKLRALQACGLDEIRFDIAADAYRLGSVALATEYLDTVSIEIPAIPEDVDRLKDMLLQMESLGVKHLNLHQLIVNERNRRCLANRRYASRPEGEDNDTYAVEASRVSALDVLNYGANVLTNMGVHYCSYEYKKKYQKIGYRRRWSRICREEADLITRSGLMRRIHIDGKAARSVEEGLHSDNLPKTVVTYYKPELQEVDKGDKAYNTCEILGRHYGYTFRKTLLYEFAFDSEVELFIYYNLFELNVEPEILVNELSASINASDAKNEEIKNLVYCINSHFEELE